MISPLTTILTVALLPLASNPTVPDPVKTRLRCGPSPVLRCPLVGVVALVATNDPVGGNPELFGGLCARQGAGKAPHVSRGRDFGPGAYLSVVLGISTLSRERGNQNAFLQNASRPMYTAIACSYSTLRSTASLVISILYSRAEQLFLKKQRFYGRPDMVTRSVTEFAIFVIP